jgi:hypothetical protein
VVLKAVLLEKKAGIGGRDHSRAGRGHARTGADQQRELPAEAERSITGTGVVDPAERYTGHGDSKDDHEEGISGGTTIRKTARADQRTHQTLNFSGGTTKRKTARDDQHTHQSPDERSSVGAETSEQLDGPTEGGSWRARRRQQRQPLNISVLGEINMLSVTRATHVFMTEEHHPQKLASEPVEPTDAKMALESPEKEQWQMAMKEESDALNQKRVMRLVDLKPGMTIIKWKYVFKLKKSLVRL